MEFVFLGGTLGLYRRVYWDIDRAENDVGLNALVTFKIVRDNEASSPQVLIPTLMERAEEGTMLAECG